MLVELDEVGRDERGPGQRRAIWGEALVRSVGEVGPVERAEQTEVLERHLRLADEGG